MERFVAASQRPSARLSLDASHAQWQLRRQRNSELSGHVSKISVTHALVPGQQKLRPVLLLGLLHACLVGLVILAREGQKFLLLAFAFSPHHGIGRRDKF